MTGTGRADPGTRRLEVLEPGPLTLVQDAGRPGLAHLGVPRSGWLDASAATLANRLVGNDEGSAVLECLLGGLAFEMSAATTVAVTGAWCPVAVDGRPRAHGAAVPVPAGGRVTVGTARLGLRAYVGVAGGIAVEPVLGSRSTDTLSGTGPAPLAAGRVLSVGPAVGVPSAAEAVHRGSGGPTVLRCTSGPRADWFRPGVLDTLGAAPYVVQADSDRVGLRLAGTPLERSRPGELPSEGLVLGAVQVPADGQPLVFLNDHPTTGGYPVVAVIDRRDLAQCAQLRPGDAVSVRPGPAPAPGSALGPALGPARSGAG